MAENSSGKRMLISFTLPISCQICLGKVKQPIVCPNQHVFCSSCIELWLQHNQQCPTCRVPITPENPCKQILGGQTQDGESDSYMSTPALRRTRFDILYQDCEREIKRLEDENEFLKNSNCELQDRLADMEEMVTSKSELVSNEAGAASSPTTSSSSTTEPKLQLHSKAWRDCTNSSPKSSPSRGKLKARGEKRESFSSADRDGNYNCEEGGNSEVLATLRSKLKQATTTYVRIKQDMDKLKETNLKLSTDNRTLLAENGRLKQTAAARSPHKYEKYTSMAQQSKLDQSRREVSQLKRALDRSDTYIDELEAELQGYKSQCGPLTKETGGSGDKSNGASSRDSSDDPGTPGKTNKSGDGNIPSASSCGIFKSMDTSKSRNPLIVLGQDRHSTMPVYTNQDPKMSTDIFTYDDTYRNYIKNKKASRVCVTQQHEHRKGSASLDDDSDDASDLDNSDTMMTNTPSTALDRLSLDSSKKRTLSSLDETLSSEHLKTSPSCHRHLNFGKDHSKDLHIKDQNVDDDDPLDQNATFSDLNFTMTSELSDCARLMKDAERRVKNKRLNSQDINPEDQSGMKALQCSSDRPAFKDSKLKHFENLASHSHPTSDREHHEKITASMSQMNQESANTRLTWSGFKPGFRSTPRCVSFKSTEPVINTSSIHNLTSTGFITTSQSANYTAHNFSTSPPPSGKTGTLSLPCTEIEQLKSSDTAGGYSATTESVQKTSLAHPTIKSQLKPTRHLDAAQFRNGQGTGSRSRSNVDSDRNACTFDFLCNKPYANDKSDKVNSEWVSLSANNPKVQTSSGAISNEADIKGYLPSTIRGSRKRYVPQDKGSNSPSKSFKY